jgi:hypothetical protein
LSGLRDKKLQLKSPMGISNTAQGKALCECSQNKGQPLNGVVKFGPYHTGLSLSGVNKLPRGFILTEKGYSGASAPDGLHVGLLAINVNSALHLIRK